MLSLRIWVLAKRDHHLVTEIEREVHVWDSAKIGRARGEALHVAVNLHILQLAGTVLRIRVDRDGDDRARNGGTDLVGPGGVGRAGQHELLPLDQGRGRGGSEAEDDGSRAHDGEGKMMGEARMGG